MSREGGGALVAAVHAVVAPRVQVYMMNRMLRPLGAGAFHCGVEAGSAGRRAMQSALVGVDILWPSRNFETMRESLARSGLEDILGAYVWSFTHPRCIRCVNSVEVLDASPRAC